ncbi:hypothetical protein [Streptomyces sp. NPDC091215]|uniref:hypothetical protein n=1 Tax=Streptomyces sp. NPDC091215 TaxID=3155192 RepID=UPI0034475B48
MTDSASEPAREAAPAPGTAPSAPPWVKVSGAVALAAIVLFLVLHLSGAMGPGMHGGH